MTADTAIQAIFAVVQGYGYAENSGIARRQQRALSLVLQGHYTEKELTQNADGMPVVLRFTVRSESGTGHYHVTRTPNALTYECTCPDTWNPCKHRYGAALLRDGIGLAHAHRLHLHDYCRRVRALQHSHPFSSHEIAALEALLECARRYHALAVAAAKAYYGAKRNYASRLFSHMVDQAGRCYGAGYVGWASGQEGELHSVLAGRPVVPLRWHPAEVRWYVVGADGAEDVATTEQLLHPPLPAWGVPPVGEVETTLIECFEEEPDGHYALPAIPGGS